jgi:hypothetical protein
MVTWLKGTCQEEPTRLRCDALKRVKGDSRLGGFHYAPILVYEGKRIRPEHKRTLEIFGLTSLGAWEALSARPVA